ncbi:hypothetical protein E2E30_08980 [Sphingomonas sp. AAP5]|uniref:hypothetical protein n=1 Tax=Sphingomonas sp. AAP5 TaxID=1523415 RepID=UPI0010571D4C|nr:hypothetical protein [Sphingomonas sp. AAP5]QBM75891.1 hypothetical protein E2E30_08980 [Sphingomonas sp. AAP5]
MTDQAQNQPEGYIEDLNGQSVAPYAPLPGARSILAGIGTGGLPWFETREKRLTLGFRPITLGWLAQALATASGKTLAQANQALISAIPDGREDVLDGSSDVIFVVDQAAIVLGCDPEDVELSPRQMQS